MASHRPDRLHIRHHSAVPRIDGGCRPADWSRALQTSSRERPAFLRGRRRLLSIAPDPLRATTIASTSPDASISACPLLLHELVRAHDRWLGLALGVLDVGVLAEVGRNQARRRSVSRHLVVRPRRADSAIIRQSATSDPHLAGISLGMDRRPTLERGRKLDHRSLAIRDAHGYVAGNSPARDGAGLRRLEYRSEAVGVHDEPRGLVLPLLC